MNFATRRYKNIWIRLIYTPTSSECQQRNCYSEELSMAGSLKKTVIELSYDDNERSRYLREQIQKKR